MRGGWVLGLLLAAWPHGTFAEAPGDTQAEKQRLGMRLFNQSCQVCHTTVVLTGRLYGPPLSRDSLGGQEDVMREVIGNGTPRMPGFKHHLGPAQIEAIVAYLRTVPNPDQPQPSPAAAGSEATRRDAD